MKVLPHLAAISDPSNSILSDHAANLLRNFMLVLMLSSLVSGVFITLTGRLEPRNVAFAFPAVVAILCYRELASNRVNRGIVFFCWGMWLSACLASFIVAGMKTPFLYIIPVLLTTVALVQGSRATWMMAIGTVADFGVVTLAEHQGWLPSPMLRTSLDLMIVYTLVIGFTCLLALTLFQAFLLQLKKEQALSKELLQLNETLEERIEKRTLEAGRAKDAAEAASRAKSVFLANMSHELRTPLNAILGFSDILRRGSSLSEGQKEHLSIIHKSGSHLLGLINDILDIAKIEAGQVRLENAPFDFSGMILDVTDMLRLRAEEKGLQLRVDQPSEFPRYIMSDEVKLRQILINLISNAIKVTAEGGIILRLDLKHNPAEHLLIEVEDSGCGIAPAEQARILEPFVQIGSQGKQQGTGLGLAITRQFVELMGGSLTLASTVGQGSTFRVDIPIQLARPEEIPQAPRTRGEVTRLEPGQPACRVLVVEDQLESQLLLVYLLKGVGFDVRLAENGAEGVELFQAWQPHFIWMDKRMPVMDGAEATRRIRALPGGEAVKISAVTASTFREDDQELMAAGFDAIVHKPFQPEQIFECMELLLGVSFVRAEAEGAAKPWPEFSPAALAALPVSLRHDLAEALVILDSERIMEVIDKIAQTDTELATALREQVKNYNYEPILVLLRSASHTSGENESGIPQGEKQG